MLTGFKLLAAAGFGAAYLVVAFLATHPRVSPEYAAHFLRRTADCWLPHALRAEDAIPPAVVELGLLNYPEACRYLRLNWHLRESWGAWAGAREAVLGLPWKPDTAAVELTLRAAPGLGSTVRVRSVLNGEASITEIPPGATKAIVFPLPPDRWSHAPDLRLSFGSHASVPDLPPKRTMRHVSIGLVAIRYLPVPGAVAAAPGPGSVDGRPEQGVHLR